MPVQNYGAFGFDPATAVLHRPAQGVFDAVDLSVQLAHERAHWHQFAGSTIGSLILTLYRAEDYCLLILAGRDGRAHCGYRELLKAQRPIASLVELTCGLDGDAVHDLAELLRFVRSFRTAVLTGRDFEDECWATSWYVGLLLAYATYIGHTGALPASTELIKAISPPTRIPGVRTTSIPSTRQVMEAGAQLGGWAPFLVTAWNRASPGAAFTALDLGVKAVVADELRYRSGEYRECFQIALDAWGSRRVDERHEADEIARYLPTLACCIDIALNPEVAPIARPDQDLEVAHIVPGERFIQAVRAVVDEGILAAWPSESEYGSYRAAICSKANLSVGQLSRRSFQHERFDERFWCSAEADDDLLLQVTYFDYLVWAMEHMHSFRRDRPLQWAFPGLHRYAQGTAGADLTLLIDPSAVWIHAPLYWVGNEWQHEVRLSEAVATMLFISIASCMLARQTTEGRGHLTLDGLLPPELAGDSDFASVALNGVVRGTGWDELRTWTMDVPEEPMQRTSLSDAKDGREGAPPACVYIQIPRSEVEATDTATADRVFRQARRSPHESHWSYDLRFDSFDADPRGLWDIPDVTKYLQEFCSRNSDWPWYLHPPTRGGDNAGFLLCCLAQFANPRRPTEDEWERLVELIWCGIADHLGTLDEPAKVESTHARLVEAMAVVSAARLS